MRQRILGALRLATGLCVTLAARAHAQGHTPAQADPTAAWWAWVPDLLCAAGALILVAAGVVLLVGAFGEKLAGGFALRHHAGGFGGSSTGWTISTPLVRLVSGFALILLAGALAMARMPLKDDAKAGESKDDAKAAAGHDDKAEAARAASAGASAVAASAPRK